MTTTDERVSRLEGAYEQVDRTLDSIDSRLGEMNSRLNTQLTVMLGLWATLTAGIIAGLIALFITR